VESIKKNEITQKAIITEVITMVTGYCMKCKKKQEMKNAKAAKMKNGRDCVKGKCPKCDTNMFRIGKM